MDDPVDDSPEQRWRLAFRQAAASGQATTAMVAALHTLAERLGLSTKTRDRLMDEELAELHRRAPATPPPLPSTLPPPLPPTASASPVLPPPLPSAGDSGGASASSPPSAVENPEPISRARENERERVGVPPAADDIDEAMEGTRPGDGDPGEPAYEGEASLAFEADAPYPRRRSCLVCSLLAAAVVLGGVVGVAVLARRPPPPHGAILPSRFTPEQVAALEKDAANDDPHALTELGHYYAEHVVPDGPRDGERAYAHWHRAAERGHHPAQLEVGRAHLSDLYGRYDREAGLDWVRRAADAGYAPAEYRMALELYAEHRPGEASRPGEALEWLRRAAYGGHPEAEYELGRRLAEGRGMGRNVREARDWLEKAVEHGHPDARRALDALPVDP